MVYGKCEISPPSVQYTILTLCYMNRLCNLPWGTIAKHVYEERKNYISWCGWVNELIINYGINCQRIFEQNNIFQNILCFCPWTFSLNIGLNMFPLDPFMSCLHSLLGYSTGGVPGFATDCPCSVWCRGLTTCPLYVGPLFGNLV